MTLDLSCLSAASSHPRGRRALPGPGCSRRMRATVAPCSIWTLPSRCSRPSLHATCAETAYRSTKKPCGPCAVQLPKDAHQLHLHSCTPAHLRTCAPAHLQTWPSRPARAPDIYHSTLPGKTAMSPLNFPMGHGQGACGRLPMPCEPAIARITAQDLASITAIDLEASVQPPAREVQQHRLTRDGLEATAITMIPYP